MPQRFYKSRSRRARYRPSPRLSKAREKRGSASSLFGRSCAATGARRLIKKSLASASLAARTPFTLHPQADAEGRIRSPDRAMTENLARGNHRITRRANVGSRFAPNESIARGRSAARTSKSRFKHDVSYSPRARRASVDGQKRLSV